MVSVFGVPGDDNLAILDAIAGRPDLAWIGMATEQGAGYAADSYARLRGLGALVTTFGVGELSALNAIAGAYAESVPVVHIVGTPALVARETDTTLHHNLPGRDYGHFARMAAEITAAQADLRPHTAPEEIDRVLEHRAAYLPPGLPHHSRRRGRDPGARPRGAAAAGVRGPRSGRRGARSPRAPAGCWPPRPAPACWSATSPPGTRSPRRSVISRSPEICR